MSDRPESLLSQLKSIAPDLLILTDNDSRYFASFDNLRVSSMPEAVLKPIDENEISTILSVANKEGKAITTRGAGSATTGSASPVTDGWVIDLSDWKQVAIDPLSKVAYAQPGVTVKELDDAAAEHGLFYPPDPGSKKHATIGGTIATNAGGLRGAKYGVTRDYVMSLEGCLPTGEFVRWGADLRKFAVGYNMRDLWIGSEGTLGIITGCVLKLIDRPETTSTFLCFFPDSQHAISTAHEIIQSSVYPAAMEFMDALTVASTVKLWKDKEDSPYQSFSPELKELFDYYSKPVALLIEIDGSTDSIASASKSLNGILENSDVQFIQSDSDALTESLWMLRRSCSQAMFSLAPRKLNEDVVVPFTSQLDLINLTEDLEKKYGLPTPTFGHLADGNFHVHLMYDPDDEKQAESAAAGVRELMEAVIEMGGALSGEHGVGLAKSPFLNLQLSEAEIKAMQSVKTALDPNGVLNPHILWSPTDVMNSQREQVKLKWDH